MYRRLPFAIPKTTYLNTYLQYFYCIGYIWEVARKYQRMSYGGHMQILYYTIYLFIFTCFRGQGGRILDLTHGSQVLSLPSSTLQVFRRLGHTCMLAYPNQSALYNEGHLYFQGGRHSPQQRKADSLPPLFPTPPTHSRLGEAMMSRLQKAIQSPGHMAWVS